MTEEIFHDSVVPAIASSRHGRGNVVCLSQDKIRLGAVLISLVTVEDKSISDHFFLFGQFQGPGHQLHGVVFGQEVGNDEPIVQIFDRREICPSLPGPYESHIGDPFLIGSGCKELPVQYIRIPVKQPVIFSTLIVPASSGHRMNPHLVHQPKHSFGIDAKAQFLLNPYLDPAVSIGSMGSQISFFNHFHSI